MTPLYRHPAATYSFDTLHAGLERAVSAGAVRASAAPDASHLRLYCYSERCQYESLWDEFSVLARGIVLDLKNKYVHSYPFPKFFNYGEGGRFDLPECGFSAQEKLDGSLAIVFHDGERWRACTKGSFVSDQAKWAEQQIQAFSGKLIKGYTYLFEAIYAQNRIVVTYNFEGLVLLSAFTDEGYEFTRGACENLAQSLGTRICAEYPFTSMKEAIEAVSAFDKNKEGVVVRFENGYRVKVKGAEYLRVHRLVSMCTPLTIWDMLFNKMDLDGARKELPEEFLTDFDRIRLLLEKGFSDQLNEIEHAVMALDGLDNKSVGLLKPGETFANLINGQSCVMTPLVRANIFHRRKDPEGWLNRPLIWRGLWMNIRPTGNRLPGYVPSSLLNNIQNEAG